MFYSQRWSLFLVFSLLALPVAPAHKAHAQSLTVQNLDQPTQPTVVNSSSRAKDSNGSVVEIDSPLQLTNLASAQTNSWLSQEEITPYSEQLAFSPSTWLTSNTLWSFNAPSTNQQVDSETPDEGESCEDSLAELNCQSPESTVNLPVPTPSESLGLSESVGLEEVETVSKPQVLISQGWSETEVSPKQAPFNQGFLFQSSIEAIPEPSISLFTWLGLSAAGLLYTSRKLKK